MSAETELRALLAANAGVAALVGQAIAHNAVPQNAAAPYVAFTAQHDRVHNLVGELLADEVTFAIQCWGKTAAQAEQVADAVISALGSAPSTRGVVITSRASAYDDETGLDATVLTVSWWA